jgi:hypothetical protein
MPYVILIVDCCKVKTTKFFCRSETFQTSHTRNWSFIEITFREVGEGTNESIDLDKFDQYYHLTYFFGMRMNSGATVWIRPEFILLYGMEGFYLNELLDSNQNYTI